jgi:serine/threonine protein kinase
MKGTLQFMAPELLGLTTTYSTNPYAADMWSLGEIAFQMLTQQPSFPQLSQLILYVQGSQPFPSTLLARYGVSNGGQNFISSTMLQSPDNRLNAIQAWNHEWMEQYKSSRLSPHPLTSARYVLYLRRIHSCL